MIRTVTVYADVEVKVDLRKFSTDTLMEELKDREEMRVHERLKQIQEENERELEEAGIEKNNMHHIPPLRSDEKHPLHGIYYALKFGKQEHAVDLMRDYLGDLFGVVL